MAPEMSELYLASAAIMARALSFTADGAMPSAQFMVGSAVAFDPAVADQVYTGIPCPRMKTARCGASCVIPAQQPGLWQRMRGGSK